MSAIGKFIPKSGAECRLQPAIVQKQRMAKLRAPQRPMTAGFASVKGVVL
nr:hypothetical protein [Klebsiella pneumoniae]